MIQKQLRYDENNDPWMEIFDEGGTLDRYFFDGYIVHITPYGEEIETLEEYCVGRTPMECRAAFELAAESIFKEKKKSTRSEKNGSHRYYDGATLP